MSDDLMTKKWKLLTFKTCLSHLQHVCSSSVIKVGLVKDTTEAINQILLPKSSHRICSCEKCLAANVTVTQTTKETATYKQITRVDHSTMMMLERH